MSAQGWIGKSLAIALSGNVIAAVRAKSVRYAAQPIDITDGESNGFRRILEVADSFTVEVDVDGVATSENYPILRDQWYGETFSDIEIRHADGTVEVPEDGAFLASLSATGESKGHVSFQARFLMSGAVHENSVAPVLAVAQYGPSIRLVWSAATVPDAPVAFYEIYRRINGGGFDYFDDVDGEVLTYIDDSEFEEGEEVDYYVIAYGQGTSELQSNTEAVIYEIFTGIEAAADSFAEKQWTGYSVSELFQSGPGWGVLFGDPLPGYNVYAVTDAEGGYFANAPGFVVVARKTDSSLPATNLFGTVQINGENYDTADCVNVGTLDDMTWAEAQTCSFTSASAPFTNCRLWFWPLQAGIEHGAPYALSFI